MLSDEQLFDARESTFAFPFRAKFSEAERFEIRQLRAVEAAVRADQIERDGKIAESTAVRVCPCGLCQTKRGIAAAIRAQLTEGNTDE